MSSIAAPTAPLVAHTPRRRLSARLRAPLAGAVTAGAFHIGFATADFTNDHFVHLSMAQQIVAYGEMPDRDFVDQGGFLSILLSAAAQALFGPSLLPELVLTLAFIAVSIGLVFLLAERASRSVTIGLLAALFALALGPRLYNYGKLFAYAIAFILYWRYADRPSVQRFWGLAAWTVIAFLLRHDYGLFVGAGALAVILASDGRHHVRGRVRCAAYFAAAVLSLLVPYLAYLESGSGIVHHFRRGLSASRAEAHRTGLLLTPALLTREPPEPVPVSVRWTPETDDTTRAALETRYRLSSPEPELDGSSTWHYLIANPSTENLRALVHDPHAEDTRGIHRTRYRPWSYGFLLAALKEPWSGGGLRLDERFEEGWIYWVCVAIPLLAALLVAMRRHDSPLDAGALGPAHLLPVIIVGLLINFAYLRDPLDARLADVAVPNAVLGAWMAGLLRKRLADRTPVSMVAAIVLVGLVVVTLDSAMTVGRFRDAVRQTGMFGGPVAMAASIQHTTSEFSGDPLRRWAPHGSVGDRVLARYLRECLTTDDKAMVTWFSPQLFFYSGRGFGGGEVYFMGGYGTSERDQRLALERLSRDVPVVIGNATPPRPTEWDAFEESFPLLASAVDADYVVAAETPLGGTHVYRIFARRDRPARAAWGTDRLPCFR